MEKITTNMSTMDMVMVMTEGNPGAMMVIMDMLKDPKGFLDILLLDHMEIRGSHLYMLHNDCCGRNNDKFKRTLKMFRCGTFTQAEINANLERTYAVPFIDDSVEIEGGIPPYGADFGPTHPKWEEWCKAQRTSFERRIRTA